MNSNKKKSITIKTTLVSVCTNIVLVILQIFVGVFGHSQALIADGFHSLSDLISDFIVLITHKHSTKKPDDDHHYGHSRYENVATFLIGALLIAVGVIMAWRAGIRLTHIEEVPPIHFSALIVALIVLVAKESLFHYMMRQAKKIRSTLLMANAWHARSDAASSLVVAIGVSGSLLGFPLFDPIAAAIVGFIIARMGWVLAWDALQDLSDRALDSEITAQLHQVLITTPGVQDVSALRTRKMGDFALVDAHVLVNSHISVSEGHYIAETARKRLEQDCRVLDALIHIDPESDELVEKLVNLPTRGTLLMKTRALFSKNGIEINDINMHYLDGGIDLEIYLSKKNDKNKFEKEIISNQKKLTNFIDLSNKEAIAKELNVRCVKLFYNFG